jgi:hypothetical protein
MNKSQALSVIKSLRMGQPPLQGLESFSIGLEPLIKGFKSNRMAQIGERGDIVFVNGSSGSGKTHLFRLIRQAAFDTGFLVSNVELHAKETPFSKFDKVFSAIVRKIRVPGEDDTITEAEPFARVLDRALSVIALGNPAPLREISNEQYNKAHDILMADRRIDIDFKKIVVKYWETYVPHRAVSHPMVSREIRGEALQWFSGEGKEQTFRTKFAVNKMITPETARTMLPSLAGFIGLAGYEGLVILFDEGTQAYETMDKKDLKHAYSNLFHLVNNIDQSSGLLLVYATTPEFYSNKRYGILNHPHLAGRVGKPREKPPKPRDTIWNLDALHEGTDSYKQAAMKVRAIYVQAYEDDEEDTASKLPSEEEICAFVEDLAKKPADIAGIRLWRVMMPSLIQYFEDYLEGDARSAEDYYEDAMELLREED